MIQRFAKDYLPLVQALANKEIIQSFRDGKWFDDDAPCFLDPPSYYRIKPKPRECWVRFDVDNNPVDVSPNQPWTSELVLMREVIQ